MRTLLSEAELRSGVQKLASEIDDHYGPRPLTVIAIMTGSLVLFADLIRRLSMPQRVGVVQASSYRGGTTSGQLHVDAAMMIDVKGRDVLLVDDIFETGKTLSYQVTLVDPTVSHDRISFLGDIAGPFPSTTGFPPCWV